jgi:GntR family transcriptional repressor for pyruvate dehydrogenase complex
MPPAPSFEVEPVRATRTFEAAIEHLTEAIERAGLRTGDRLPNEGALAEQLGISKPTLRQALRVLELSGLVEVRRGKSGGIFVVTDLVPSVAIFTAVKLEEEAAVDVLRARRVLERAVVHEAMRMATPADLVELERTIELLERHLGERPSVMRADAMFHRALVRSCRNETIQTAMRGVATRALADPGCVLGRRRLRRSHARGSTAARSTRCGGTTRTRSSRCSTSTSACSRPSSRRESDAAGPDLFGPRARRAG